MQPLQAEILSLPPKPPESAPLDWAWNDGYARGHIDAVRAAASLVAQRQAQAHASIQEEILNLPLPEPALHAHELIANGGGVWLGCSNRSTVEQAHDAGETGDVILSLYTTEQVRDLLLAAASLVAQKQAQAPAVSGQYAELGLAAAWRTLLDEMIPASTRYVRAIKAHREACGSSLKDAKEAVDGLRSGEIRAPSAQAPAGQGWISVDERMPEAGQTVLAYWPRTIEGPIEGWQLSTAQCWPGSAVEWHNPEDDEDDYAPPTHWMPLPSPPTSDKEVTK